MKHVGTCFLKYKNVPQQSRDAEFSSACRSFIVRLRGVHYEILSGQFSIYLGLDVHGQYRGAVEKHSELDFMNSNKIIISCLGLGAGRRPIDFSMAPRLGCCEKPRFLRLGSTLFFSRANESCSSCPDREAAPFVV